MLTIYSASAGTGKTHTLTGEYLSLLFKGKERHRHILAVTFTNKATGEMKSRIIEELFRLANDQPSTHISRLSANCQTTESHIRIQAKCILQTILHDYSAFHISTIDRFFQQTLRAFTREIGLQGNYQVELEIDTMLEKAVENMLAELEKSENATLMNWLLHFMENKIEEGSGWNIRPAIIKLSKQLFQETYKSSGDQIQDVISQKDFLTNYLQTLHKIIRTTRETAKTLGEQGIGLMRQHSMQAADFRGGATRSPFRFFEKLVNGEMDAPSNTFRELADKIEGYLAKKASPQLQQAAERLYENGMNQLIKNTVSFFDQLADYHTAREIARNFYALGILTDLSHHIAKWRADNNRMLIADTTELLHKIIDGSEIPFIYEKTGVRIEHYMIDEFQDTSAMQWSNFRPLLKESLDNGHYNLIVGDVKQSIYRFRNSDWKLLDRQVKKDFDNQVKEILLDTNWRSSRHIVQFNNSLFETLPGILQELYNEEVATSSLSPDEKERYQTSIVSAYKNVSQQVAPTLTQQDGHVRIQFLCDNETHTWEEQSMQQLPRLLERLQTNGYALRDLAILTRTNAEGLLVAQTLLNYKETHPDSPYKYDIISEDTLTVGASRSVRFLIAMLRHLSRPENKNYREMAHLAYSMLKLKTMTPQDSKAKHVAIQQDNQLSQIISPACFAKLKQLSHHSLYELTEGLFRIFASDLPSNELVYIQTFLDLISEFTAAETGDMGRFLTWWDETGYKKKIITPDSQNAIRIMTIHKSKGLGFKVVIMPFADWNIDQKNTIVWCHPTQKPFDAMQLVPVSYNKTLKDTIFASDYFTEKLHAYIDSLNVLYVALTRARKELIVMAPQSKTQTVTVAGLLTRRFEQLNADSIDEELIVDRENGLYECGEWQQSLDNDSRPPSTTQDETVEWAVERLYSLPPDNRMLLRLRHQGNIFGDEKRKYGLLMHDILSGIEKRDDITRTLSEKYFKGEINREDVALLKAKLYSLIDGNKVNKWFDGSMQVMNETDILFGNGQSVRPDRIMIDQNNKIIIVDYKFGEQKEDFHQRQIEQYISLIHAMGYQNVSGYLWYVTLYEIEEFVNC